MDLLWLVAFMMMVRGEKLRWQHLLGLTIAGVGVAVANFDVDAEF
jgi:drug/metabolite transporter (DMT)-like permease